MKPKFNPFAVGTYDWYMADAKVTSAGSGKCHPPERYVAVADRFEGIASVSRA
jgi:hypothetical protein